MITLTRLGGEPLIVNAELIQYVEALPDTFITLTTGQRLVVAEAMDEVLRRAMVYQQAKHLSPRPLAEREARIRRAFPPDNTSRKVVLESLACLNGSEQTSHQE